MADSTNPGLVVLGRKAMRLFLKCKGLLVLILFSSLMLLVYSSLIRRTRSNFEEDEFPSNSLRNERLDLLIARLQNVLPKQFSKETKNPCWQSVDTVSHLLCLPYFFLIGYPKCGTTELYSILTLHPQFAAPKLKEPEWWTGRKANSDIEKYFYLYLNNFAPAAVSISRDPRKVTADCTGGTAWRPLFKKTVNEYPIYSMPYLFSRIFPTTKYLVVMRNPIDHIYSRFWYNCKLHNINAARMVHGPQIFEILVTQRIEAVKRCIEATGDIATCTALNTPQEYIHELSDEEKRLVDDRMCGIIILTDCLYYISLKEWFKFIPRAQFLILQTEDMLHDTVSTAQKVFRFLGLDDMDENELTKGLKMLGRVNSQDAMRNSSLAMTDSAKRKLQDFFAPYNRKLANLLHDDHYLWE